MLLDRTTEIEAIDELLQSARRGASGALVLVGEPGIGKSSLVEYAIESAGEMTVASVTGFESEMEMSFAALHQLVAPMLDRVGELPVGQGRALASAFGFADTGAPDRLLVGLAVLTLLSDAAERRPVLCTVDNVDCLDQASEQVLAFVARRIDAEGIAFLFTAGDPATTRLTLLEGLPFVRVRRLSDEASRDLLARASSGPIDAGVRERLVQEMKGNPQALLELSAELTVGQLAGSTALPVALPLAQRITESFARRMSALPLETRMLLLLLAAEPAGGDEQTLWPAATELGIARSALEPAEAAGLVSIGPPVQFRQTFAQAAVYSSSPPEERRRAHGALAEVADLAAHRDRRAWHRAAASVGPDEEIAHDLEAGAAVAGGRGGYASTAEFLQRAAELSSDPSRKAARTLSAASAHIEAGSSETALSLLAQLEPVGEAQTVQADAIRGSVMFRRARLEGAHEALSEAARALEPLDLRLARDAHLEALTSALFAGSLGRPGLVSDAAAAAQAAPKAASVTVADRLLDGLALLVTEGHAAAAPSLREAIESVRGSDDLALFLACDAAAELWDDEALRRLTNAWARTARDRGALNSLAQALLCVGCMSELLAGRLDAADDAILQARELFVATGSDPGRAATGAVFVAAWRGREDDTRRLAEEAMRSGIARGVGAQVGFAHHCLGVLELGLGRYEAASTSAQEARANGSLLGVTWTLPDLVEAAVRTKDRTLALDACAQLETSTRAGGTDWGLGMLARTQALLAKGRAADGLYREAISRLARSRASVHLARARLLYGEWLRRSRRKRDAREQLRGAHELLTSIGSLGFAERAATELAASGERRVARRPAAMELLTPHELRIARMAATGESNAEIAAQLYISRRTVEYHLHKIFRKLGLTSRAQISSALEGSSAEN